MSKAFTLIELVIVSTIVLILLGFAVVSFSPNNEMVNKRKGIDHFLFHYYYAQDFAMAENKYAHFIINKNEMQYQLFSSSNGEDKTEEIFYVENSEIVIIELDAIFQTIDFTGSDISETLEIIFTPWGTNTRPEGAFISFDGVNINIEGITGFVF